MKTYKIHKKHGWLVWLACVLPLSGAWAEQSVAELSARELVREAINYWRDESSYSLSEMIIHRPDWERAMTLKVWTRGEDDTLVRVEEPARDAGNATLVKGEEMWSYAPKTGRVIKIPSSMMSQGWMGSDFSNNDVSKADKIVEDYHHKILERETVDGRRLYTVEARPKEFAPVVWGREVVKIREDYLILEHLFYDQDNVLVKKMETLEIREMGGKLVASKQRMNDMEKPEHWTEIRVQEAEFEVDIPAATFTLSNLRNPRF